MNNKKKNKINETITESEIEELYVFIVYDLCGNENIVTDPLPMVFTDKDYADFYLKHNLLINIDIDKTKRIKLVKFNKAEILIDNI